MKNDKLQSEVKLKLIETAGELFATKGFKSTTIREICQKANANVAAVNYHFGDKETLYQAAFEHVCTYLDKLHDPIDDSLAPEEKLHEFIRRRVRSFIDKNIPAWHSMLLHQGRIRREGKVQKSFLKIIEARSSRLKKILCELTGLSEKAEELIYIKFSIMGQILFYNKLPQFRIPDRQYMKSKYLDEIVEHIYKFSMMGMGLGHLIK